MNRLSSLSLLLISLSLVSQSARGQSQQNWCGTADQMEWLKYRANDFVKKADSSRTSAEATKKHSGPEITQVIEIHDQAICERAARTYYRSRLGPYPADGVAVVRFGDKYGVYGDIRGGEWTLLEVYNLNFEPIGGYWS
jgi:hypothetical protein